MTSFPHFKNRIENGIQCKSLQAPVFVTAVTIMQTYTPIQIIKNV